MHILCLESTVWGFLSESLTSRLPLYTSKYIKKFVVAMEQGSTSRELITATLERLTARLKFGNTLYISASASKTSVVAMRSDHLTRYTPVNIDA